MFSNEEIDPANLGLSIDLNFFWILEMWRKYAN